MSPTVDVGAAVPPLSVADRDVDDRGVLMLCDPRLLTRSYGRIFLDNIPAMRRTRSLGEVEAFFDVPAASAVEAAVGELPA